MKTKWQYTGDVNMLDYGGTNWRQSGNRQFQFIELINLHEATGETDQSKYVVELRLVDLHTISSNTLQSALKCCGQENVANPSDEILAECCNSYGCYAPLGSWTGNNARNLMRDAYKLANELLNANALESRLERPVNRIGSTAREVMHGDFTSALQRGCESGNTSARIMAKIHGIPQDAIDNTRPDDWLPYMFGYMAGLNGGAKETNPDTSPEYFRGYQRGENVKAGKCPAPDWIKQSNVQA